MKTLAPHYVGDWESRGAALRLRGLNRLGDLLVPNLNYVALEEWFMPLLRAMHDEQGGGEDGRSPLRRAWTPSAVCARLGAALTDESSILYWAARNRIPVFCPGLTDGASGDMLFFHSRDRPGFLLDVAGDVRRINKAAMRAKKSGMLILGGGTPKHHTCNANLMRNGADFAVFVNTGAEFDAWAANQRDTLAREHRGLSLLDYWESIIDERHRDYVAIKTERDRTAATLYHTVQRRLVIDKAKVFFLEAAMGGAGAEATSPPAGTSGSERA